MTRCSPCELAYSLRPGDHGSCYELRGQDTNVWCVGASAQMRPGEVAGTPFLSFDGVPDRLAWAVPVNGPDGPRMGWVAGAAVWSGSASTGLG